VSAAAAAPAGVVEIIDGRGQAVGRAGGAFVLTEARRYTLRAPAGCTSAHLNGVELPRDGRGGFLIELPFAVGRYHVRLQQVDLAEEHALEVLPDGAKLDPETWMALLDELEAWLPGLATGVEGARLGGVGHTGAAAPLLVEALLPLLPALDRALTAVLDAPRLRTTEQRAERPLHQARRADRGAIIALGRAPATVAALAGKTVGGRPPTLWVTEAEPTLDHAANRHVAWLIHRVILRLEQAAAILAAATGTELLQGERWLASRAAACAGWGARLKRRWRASIFAPLAAEAASAGALLVVQDHPTYGRLHRLAWRIIGARFDLGPAPLQAATRPSFTLYELWCFLAVQRVISDLLGEGWAMHSRGLDALLALQGTGAGARVCWSRGAGADRAELRLDFNLSFPRLQRLSESSGRHTLSKQRRPDLTLRVSGPGGSVWAVLDAKYRVGQSNVADAMESVHIYRDALRWPAAGGAPVAGFLLCPDRADGDALWFDPAFHAAHGMGALCLRPGKGTPSETRDALAALIAPALQSAEREPDAR
jgi:hypothetical protein